MVRGSRSGTTVRKLQKKDCEAAGKFCRTTIKWMYDKHLKGFYPIEAFERDWSTMKGANLAKWMKNPDSYGFTVLSNGRIWGIVLGRIYGKSGLAKISWIAVDPKHQNKGIGLKLLTATEDHLRKKGCHKMFLSTLTRLVPAIKLYMKFGLMPESYLRKHWWGMDFIVMSKWIGEYKKS